ncbi:unnamed protein product [Vitrella brassicaformis CCMP3155]|uniref:Clp1 P-loop domain-containing protein n=1 Tax=Vitrella brassicaformis (strain CCMP3155) TaxID=1169540 RepID=A0A0G4F5K1_VITBC|nr:unnamed protein product [Vitrella brassicaformis CCMP3155]|eukprot:CEM07629.1 unnamed protein product [Vitrella brassicaformis CCMP3155]
MVDNAVTIEALDPLIHLTAPPSLASIHCRTPSPHVTLIPLADRSGLYVHRAVWVKAVRGRVDVGGYRLDAREEGRYVRLGVPSWGAAYVVRALRDGDGGDDGAEGKSPGEGVLEKLRSSGVRPKVDSVLQILDPKVFPVIVSVKVCPWTSGSSGWEPYSLHDALTPLAKPMTASDPLMLSEFASGWETEREDGTGKDDPTHKWTPPVLHMSDQWNAAVEQCRSECGERLACHPPAVVVAGPKGAGKSTLCRVLTNTFLNAHPNHVVYYLESDVGQPDWGPAGLVALYKVERPALSSGHNNIHTAPHIHAVFFGAISPSRNPMHFRRAVQRCHAAYQALVQQSQLPPSTPHTPQTPAASPSDNNTDTMGMGGDAASTTTENVMRRAIDHLPGPLVVNTPGWVTGLGLELLKATISCVEPDLVVKLGMTSNLDEAADQGVGGVIDLTKKDTHVIDAPATTAATAAATMPTPAAVELRWLRFAAYFQPRFGLALSVPLKASGLDIDEMFQSPVVVKMGGGEVCGVGGVDDGAQEGPRVVSYPLEDLQLTAMWHLETSLPPQPPSLSPTLPFDLPGAVVGLCCREDPSDELICVAVGYVLGMVTSGDEPSVRVLTSASVPLSELKRVNVIVFSELQWSPTPPSTLLPKTAPHVSPHGVLRSLFPLLTADDIAVLTHDANAPARKKLRLASSGAGKGVAAPSSLCPLLPYRSGGLALEGTASGGRIRSGRSNLQRRSHGSQPA